MFDCLKTMDDFEVMIGLNESSNSKRKLVESATKLEIKNYLTTISYRRLFDYTELIVPSLSNLDGNNKAGLRRGNRNQV